MLLARGPCGGARPVVRGIREVSGPGRPRGRQRSPARGPDHGHHSGSPPLPLAAGREREKQSSQNNGVILGTFEQQGDKFSGSPAQKGGAMKQIRQQVDKIYFLFALLLK